jgi:hypothetical protein
MLERNILFERGYTDIQNFASDSFRISSVLEWFPCLAFLALLPVLCIFRGKHFSDEPPTAGTTVQPSHPYPPPSIYMCVDATWS